MIAKINQLLQEVEALKAANAEELEALRIKYLSKKGAINDLMADFRNVAAEQKKEVGMRLNELKNKAQEKIAALKEQFESQDTGCDDIDLTRSAYPVELGTRHPLSIVRNEIIDIFARMGFNIADGPEMEDDWHVFSSMNFAEDHPARDMQDTFFIENDTYCKVIKSTDHNKNGLYFLVYILSPLFFLGSSSDCRKLRLNFSHCLEVLSRFRYCSQVIILNS